MRAIPLLALAAAVVWPVPLTGQDRARAREAALWTPEELFGESWDDIRAAADNGLAWLAANQTEEGCWTGHVGHKQGDGYRVFTTADEQRVKREGHLGVTAIAGLAFLAGGHIPGRGKYGEQVRKVIDYVIAHVRENGYLSDSGTRMYSHAFATLFLAEVHGMVAGKRTKDALERAVHWIVDCQNDLGGWRYNPFTREADLSVTVCQLQALRAARNIGIKVPKATIGSAVAYVMRSRESEDGLFYYKIRGRGAWQKRHQFAINAAALTSLFTAGVHDAEIFDPTLDWLDSHYAEVADYYPTHFYFWYGNYYASQAFFQAGGARFKKYYRRLCGDLLGAQSSSGQWHNSTGPGDAFATGVACVLLQIPYQYLPIFQR